MDEGTSGAAGSIGERPPLPVVAYPHPDAEQAARLEDEEADDEGAVEHALELEDRQQAADLTTRLAVVIKQCGEDQLLSKLGLVLFEQLGEEYPDTLGSIIAAEGAIANVVGMTQMNPPVKDLRE